MKVNASGTLLLTEDEIREEMDRQYNIDETLKMYREEHVSESDYEFFRPIIKTKERWLFEEYPSEDYWWKE